MWCGVVEKDVRVDVAYAPESESEDEDAVSIRENIQQKDIKEMKDEDRCTGIIGIRVFVRRVAGL